VNADWRNAWTAALDALEADVVEVEGLLAHDHRLRDLPLTNPWSPPEGLGPLPLDLRPRADAILSRQLAAATDVAMAIAANRRQLTVLNRIESGHNAAPPRPAYVDCAM
jgi:hypothetical protein